MRLIENRTFGQERALYGSNNIELRGCAFEGQEDGESALKECTDITVLNTLCRLRYPFWHDRRLTIRDCELTDSCRAAIWYSYDVEIYNSRLHGIKALRECGNVKIEDSDIVSPEFGWSVHDIHISGCTALSEYFMLCADGICATRLEMSGKYSFQYIKDSTFDNCVFNTKDAFWHARNVTIRDSIINGEYLAWYSDGLTLENCIISGTQPLCYCKNLRLVNCRMDNTDLSFEKSDVYATLTSGIVSIKNPSSGIIYVPSVGELIMDDEKAYGKVITSQDEK